MKKQRVKEGDLLRIQLAESKFAYGRVLKHAEMAFYNYQGSNEKEDTQAVYDAPIAFIVGVYDSSKKSGRWPVVDTKALEPILLERRLYFIKDIHTEKFSIYESDTGEMHSATRQQCEGLERAAVWEAEHVEDRLRDFFEGKANKWAEQLKLDS